jgi:hypothetical protein
MYRFKWRSVVDVPQLLTGRLMMRSSSGGSYACIQLAESKYT